jgi:hypothetical protein
MRLSFSVHSSSRVLLSHCLNILLGCRRPAPSPLPWLYAHSPLSHLQIQNAAATLCDERGEVSDDTVREDKLSVPYETEENLVGAVLWQRGISCIQRPQRISTGGVWNDAITNRVITDHSMAVVYVDWMEAVHV